MILDLDIIGALTLLACALAFVARWLIDRGRTERAVYTEPVTVPGPGMCGCGAPKCPPQPAPFPGDEPVQAAAGPVPVPGYVAEAIGHDGDTEAWVVSAWNRIQAGELREKLRAES